LDWRYELPKGQRIFASAFAAAGRIYFGTSTSETEDPCEGAGNPLSNAGKLYVMDIEQNVLLPTPKFTIDTGDILTAPVVDDENLYVKTGKGFYLTPGPYNNPITGPPLPPSVITWREIFGKDELSSTTTP
jgi:outer membrane protein assembly factor BamB